MTASASWRELDALIGRVPDLCDVRGFFVVTVSTGLLDA